MSPEISTVYISIKVIPRAKRTEMRGRMADGCIRIALKAPPVDGKANAELLRFIAGEFGVPVSSVELVSGSSSRRKRILVRSCYRLPQWFG